MTRRKSQILCPAKGHSGKMILLYQIGAAVLLVLFTVFLQGVGIAGLITWLRSVRASDMGKLRISNSAALVMQITVAVIVLQGLIILFWASCYRLFCFSTMKYAPVCIICFHISKRSPRGSGMRELVPA